jgi:poly(hydroxyalkanoate) granule-associated protein
MSDDKSPKINVTRGKKKRSKKKSSKKKSAGSDLPGAMEMASGLARRARNMWLAGLGALSVAEEAGTQVFNALVEEGKSWEQERRKKTERTAKQVQNLTEEGTQAIEAVEQRVRTEVNDALKQIGVPRRDDVQELRDQVDALSKKMDALADAVAEKQDTSNT